LNNSRLACAVAAIAFSITLAGCVTTPRSAQVVVQPAPQPAPTTVVVAPPPRPRPPVVVAQPVVRETYVPARYDVYIAAVVDRDVLYINGSTYIWITGSDGMRHRQFYAHGDHRQDVFRRRAHLREVMAHHNGHLPDRYARDEHHREAVRHEEHRESVAMREQHHQAGHHDAMHEHGHEHDHGPHEVAQHPQGGSHNHAVHEAAGHHPSPATHEAAGNRANADRDARKS